MSLTSPNVVCFGVLSYLQLMVVEEPASRNGGAAIKQKLDSFGDDAAIVAAMLHGWRVHSRLVPSALGKDEYGRKVAAVIEPLGLDTELTVNPKIETVFEVSVADRTGDRTYYYQRTPQTVATLDRADLDGLENARFLYVDWYDGDHILRPIKAAAKFGVPVFVNIESQFDNRELLKGIGPYATVFQATVDESDADEKMLEAARMVLDAGVGIALVTGGSSGCLATDGKTMVRVEAPKVEVADGNGAGSCFAAGFIYGRLQEWPLERCARLATAQASLKCSRVGYTPFSVEDGERLAATLAVDSRAW